MLPIFFHIPEIHCSMETYGVTLSFFHIVVVVAVWMVGIEKREDLVVRVEGGGGRRKRRGNDCFQKDLW